MLKIARSPTMSVAGKHLRTPSRLFHSVSTALSNQTRKAAVASGYFAALSKSPRLLMTFNHGYVSKRPGRLQAFCAAGLAQNLAVDATGFTEPRAQQRDPRGTRYQIVGPATDGRLVAVICRIKSNGKLLFITTYLVE